MANLTIISAQERQPKVEEAYTRILTFVGIRLRFARGEFSQVFNFIAYGVASA